MSDFNSYALMEIYKALCRATKKNERDSTRSKKKGKFPPDGRADIYAVRIETIMSAREKVKAALKETPHET